MFHENRMLWTGTANRIVLGAIIVVLLLGGFVFGETGPSKKRTHDIQPDDYFTIAQISNCELSPDGRFVAYTERRWDQSINRQNSDLWVVEMSSKQSRRLTLDPAADGSAQWNPDSRYIYFVSNRKQANETAARQVWRIAPDGSALQQITRVEGGIAFFELSRDGSALYYTLSKKHIADEWKELRTRFENIEYGHGRINVTQVWKLDLQTWRSEKIVDDNRVISHMAVSADQRHVAFISRPDNTLLSNEGWSRVELYDAETGKVSIITAEGWREAHPSPYGWLGSLGWSADDQALVFTVAFDGYPAEIYIAEFRADGISLQMMKRPEMVTLRSGSVRWHSRNRHLYFLGQKRARQRLYRLSQVRNGAYREAKELSGGDVVVDAFSFVGENLVVIKGGQTYPQDIYRVAKSGEYDRLTRINPQIDTWKLPKISIVQWYGADGQPVEGILELPPDHDGESPLPMIVQIHGGPTSATMYRFQFSTGGRTLFPSQGYALLSPNYRGSTGYGDKFMIDLIGQENKIEVRDILAGVKAMVDRGIADSSKLGVMGWSNGGFLTNCLISTTDQFAAASSGAGVVSQVMEWGLEDTPGHVINYMVGLPWHKQEAYRAASPLYNLHKVVTPTLIHVGANDERVPAAHAKTLYRALQHYLDVDTELVIYLGEGHGLSQYDHRKAKMEWDLAWFDKYLGDTPAKMTMEKGK
jgi:dipeptidyl aminopeptidase/acylaminoacyl peptidase